MSLDRAIMLPHEFDKKEEDNLPDVTVEVLRRSTRTSAEWPPNTGEEGLQNPRPADPDDGKQND